MDITLTMQVVIVAIILLVITVLVCQRLNASPIYRIKCIFLATLFCYRPAVKKYILQKYSLQNVTEDMSWAQ